MGAHGSGMDFLSYDPSHSRRYFWPRQVEPLCLRVLLLGVSVAEACTLAKNNPTSDFLLINLESTAAVFLPDDEKMAVDNLELRTLALRSIRRLKDKFDYIVYQHDRLGKDTLENICRWLPDLLHPCGLVCVRVYSTAYKPVFLLQQSLRSLGWHQNAQAQNRLSALFEALPTGHALRKYMPDVTGQTENTLQNLFFDDEKQNYSVSELLSCIEETPLCFVTWVEPAYYRLDNYLPTSHPLLSAVLDCDMSEQAALCDAIMQERPWHEALLCRQEEQQHFALNTSEESFLHWIPALRGQVDVIQAAQAGCSCKVARQNFYFELDYSEAKYVELMNGNRTIADIITELDVDRNYHEKVMLLRQLVHRLHSAGHVQCHLPCNLDHKIRATPLSPQRLEKLLFKAFAHAQRQENTAAMALYAGILERHPDAHRAAYNLGVLYAHHGYYNKAYTLLKCALEQDPRQWNHWLSFIELLLRSGKAHSAQQILQQGQEVGLQGEEVDAVQQKIDRDVKAQQAALQLLALDAEDNTHNSHDTATRILQQHMGNPYVLYAYVRTLLKNEAIQDDESGIALLQQLEAACALQPCNADLLNIFGLALKRCGKFAKAHIVLKKILEISPKNADVLYNIGGNLSKQGRNAEAIVYLRAALASRPSGIDIKIALATVLFNERKDAECTILVREIMESAGALAEDERAGVLELHGALLLRNGHTEEGKAVYESLLNTRPFSPKFFLRAKLQLPIILKNSSYVDAVREDFLHNVKELSQTSIQLSDSSENVGWPSFYLAYHNRDNRHIMEALANMYANRMPCLTHHNTLLDSLPPSSKNKIRVGFISGLLHAHTMGKLNQGFIRHLDRDKFEVIVIRLFNSPRDGFSRLIDSFADAVVRLPEGIVAAQETLDKLKLHILYFTDIGMTPDSYFLAHGRYALVQTVTWGHPDTTGLKTIDYFLSCDLFETASAEAYYTEKLMRLPRIPSCYQPIVVPSKLISKSSLGLPENRTLYGCLQTLFKMHPDYDRILHDIVQQDPRALLVFIEGTNKEWLLLLQKRWQKTYPQLLDRSVFLPPMPLNKFMQLNAHMDVLLEPIHFGGGNTFYEAMAYGTPYVIWPGTFMRGRVMSGMYQQMGMLHSEAPVQAPVVKNLDEYAPTAVRLGKDPELCRAIREHSQHAATTHLYNDQLAVRQLETFFVKAVEAAEQGLSLNTDYFQNGSISCLSDL